MSSVRLFSLNLKSFPISAITVRVELVIMESQALEVFIIENGAGRINWSDMGRGADPSHAASTTFYDSQKDKLKLTQSDSSDNYVKNQNILTSIQHILNTASGQNTIKMLSTCHNNTSKNFKLHMQVAFEDSVLKSLKDILKTLTITVKVSFQEALKVAFEIPLHDLTNSSVDSTIQELSHAHQQNITAVNSPFTYSVILQLKYVIQIIPCPVLRGLFEEKTLADCYILTAEKTKIKCHACVLATSSDVFRTMLTSGLQESQTNTIEMTDLSETVVNMFLSYIYGLEMDATKIEGGMAFELLRVAHKYNFPNLEKGMLETLLVKPEDSFDIITIMVMYFFTEKIEDFKELCNKSLDILRKNPDELQQSSAYQELLETDPKEAANLAFKLLKLGST